MKIVSSNRRARYDYDIAETLQAGLVLNGAEVKSVKSGHISLKGSFAALNKGELWLLNAHISPYKYAPAAAFEPTRSRKLLIHKTELKQLIGSKQAGLSIVPLAIGIDHGLVKVELGVGRGKKKYDKREATKKRQAEREIARKLRQTAGHDQVK